MQSESSPGNQGSRFGKNNNLLPLNNTSKIKQVIDDIYQKEKKYVKQYIREDYLQPQNPIFNLGKYHNIKTATNFNRLGGIASGQSRATAAESNIHNIRINEFGYPGDNFHQTQNDFRTQGLGGSSTYNNSVLTNDILISGMNI